MEVMMVFSFFWTGMNQAGLAECIVRAVSSCHSYLQPVLYQRWDLPFSLELPLNKLCCLMFNALWQHHLNWWKHIISAAQGETVSLNSYDES